MHTNLHPDQYHIPQSSMNNTDELTRVAKELASEATTELDFAVRRVGHEVVEAAVSLEQLSAAQITEYLLQVNAMVMYMRSHAMATGEVQPRRK